MESSSFGRLIGVLAAPGKTFRAIAERPTWAAALIVLLAATTVVGVLANQRIDPDDLRQTVQERMERRGQVSPEQVDQGVEMAGKINAVTRWLIPVFAAVVYLLINLFFWMAFRFFAGSDLSYKTSFSVLLHAFMPQLIAALLAVPVILSRETIGIEEAQSGRLLASSLAALAPEGTGKALLSFLSSLDFFSIWTLCLLILGFHLAARVSKATAAAIVLTLWALYVAGKVGLTALFG